jgi:hypothetical protein
MTDTVQVLSVLFLTNIKSIHVIFYTKIPDFCSIRTLLKPFPDINRDLLSVICKSGPFVMYLCPMQNELTYNDRFPEPREENVKAMAKRREEYSLQRDNRAKEDNEAIARRLKKEKAE